MICPNCGKEISDNTDFCPKCYAEISKFKSSVSEEKKEKSIMNFSELRKKGRDDLNGKWKVAALMSLCVLIVLFVINLSSFLIQNKIISISNEKVSDIKSNISLSSANDYFSSPYYFEAKEVQKEFSLILIAVTLLTSLICAPFAFGLVEAILKLVKGKSSNVFEGIVSSFSSFGRFLGVYIISSIKIIVGFICAFLVFMLIFICLSFIGFDPSLSSYANPLLFISAFCIFAFTFMVSLNYALTPFVAFKEPNLNISKIVERSKDLIHGYRASFLVLSLSFFGWILLSILTCGLGFIFLIPYMYATLSNFYDFVKKNPIGKRYGKKKLEE